MLVLTRKPGQALLIGEDIKVVVTKVLGLHVSLGIIAPQEVNIRREEVEEKK